MTTSNKFFSGNEYGFATKVVIKTLLLFISEEGHNIWHAGVFIRLRLLPVIILLQLIQSHQLDNPHLCTSGCALQA